MAGVPIEELKRFGVGDDAIPLQAEMIITGYCVHRHGKDIGMLKGYARDVHKKKVRFLKEIYCLSISLQHTNQSYLSGA